MKNLLSFFCLTAMSSLAFADEIKGMMFSHQDWEIFCSNTGTCQAAGYQNDDGNNNPASLLLTRQAGAKQTVKAEFALSDYEQSMPANQLKNMHFYVNGKDLGAVAIDGVDIPFMGTLSVNQVNALLQQSTQNTEIVFKNAHYQWQISDTGMTAVLLKMDDFQKRVGTVGALVKKGKADEFKVLAAQPKLMVKQVKTAAKPYLTLQSKDKQYQAVYRSLMSTKPKNAGYDVCEGVYDNASDDIQPQAIELYKLSNHKVLAMTLCWRAAYNEGYGVWLLDESLTGKATFVTEAASGFDSGMIDSYQKGRGIGDCWASEQWAWNGQRFVQTVDRWSGMCKGLAAGGVWSLDKVESVVR